MNKKTILGTIIALFFLLAGLAVYVQSDAFSEKLRPLVVPPLRAILGNETEIGFIKANLVPPFLEVRNLVLRDGQGNRHATVRKIRAYLNPLPLVLKKVRIPLITVLEPKIFASRDANGTIALKDYMDGIITRISSSVLDREPTGRGFSTSFRSIQVRNGLAEFRDGPTSVFVSMEDVGMTVRVDLTQDHFSVNLRGARLRASAPAYPELSAEIRTVAEFDRGMVRISPIEVKTVDALILINGTAGLQASAPLALSVTMTSGPQVIERYLSRFMDVFRPPKRKNARFEATADIRGTLLNPEADGVILASGLPINDYMLQTARLSFSYREREVTVRGRDWRIERGKDAVVVESIETAFGISGGGLDIRKCEFIAQDLAFHVTGRADPVIGYDLRLSAHSGGKGNTAAFLTGLPVHGPVTVEGRLKGALKSPIFDGYVDAGPVFVRGVKFSSINGGITYENRMLRVSEVAIDEGTSHYQFDGSVDIARGEPFYTARLRVIRSDVVNIVALFYEQLPLRLNATGELSFEGTASGYRGSGALKLEKGSAYGESFERGTIIASLTTGRIAFPQVVAYKERGIVKGTGWIDYDAGSYMAELESTGIDLADVDTLRDSRLGGGFALSLRSSGSFTAPALSAVLTSESVSWNGMELGAARVDAAIRDAAMTVQVQAGDLASLQVRWALRSPYPWSVAARAESLEGDPFRFAGHEGLVGRSRVSAQIFAHLRGTGLDPSSIRGEIRSPKVSMAVGDYQIENEQDLVLTIDGETLNADALRFAGQGTRINVAGKASVSNEIDLSVTGEADLALLRRIFPEVEHAAGSVELKVSVRESWDTPDVSAEVVVRNGELKIKDVPQRFTAIKSRVILSNGRIVTDALSADIGGGNLSATGWIQFEGGQIQEYFAKASIDNVTVRYPEGMTSTLSGQLFYEGSGSERSLSGDISIKRARYDKRIEWKSMLVDIGRGLYQRKKAEVGWIGDTRVNVRFHGTDSILFQNNLAKMPLDIDVFLRGTVNHPHLLGRIEARKGFVYFRRNEFKILRASADFVDPDRMNPILDIQAETQAREYLIRLAVTGTAERSVVTLISEPSLNEPDILGLLALGKKGSELVGKEKGVGVGEAASFATGQFQDIFERRARSLTGLDRFQVDPYVGKSDTSVPRVTVGKELVQNKLYVTYSSNIGASTPEQIFRVEYLLDRHFSLVGERNELGNNGADIKYRFEFR